MQASPVEQDNLAVLAFSQALHLRVINDIDLIIRPPSGESCRLGLYVQGKLQFSFTLENALVAELMHCLRLRESVGEFFLKRGKPFIGQYILSFEQLWARFLCLFIERQQWLNLTYTLNHHFANPNIFLPTQGLTPLLKAIYRRQTNLVHLLLEAGARGDLDNEEGLNPVQELLFLSSESFDEPEDHWAEPMLLLLIQSPLVDLNRSYYSHEEDDQLFPLIYHAVSRGYVRVLQYLLEKRAVGHDFSWLSPAFCQAEERGHTEALHLLCHRLELQAYWQRLAQKQHQSVSAPQGDDGELTMRSSLTSSTMVFYLTRPSSYQAVIPQESESAGDIFNEAKYSL